MLQAYMGYSFSSVNIFWTRVYSQYDKIYENIGLEIKKIELFKNFVQQIHRNIWFEVFMDMSLEPTTYK